jgi:flagellar hook-basal body complex protein FliE
MLPIDGPGIPLIAPHTRADVDLPNVGKADAAQGIDFSAIMEQAVGRVNDQIQVAEHAGAEFAAGRLDDIHGTMLEVSKADIELRFVGNVRNKVMEAFYELWRMQI